MFTLIQRRPPVPVKLRGCENLPEDRNAINIGAWNVRTLFDKHDTKLLNLLYEMKRLKIDVLGVSETHLTSEMEESFECNGFVVIHSGRNDNIHP